MLEKALVQNKKARIEILRIVFIITPDMGEDYFSHYITDI